MNKKFRLWIPATKDLCGYFVDSTQRSFSFFGGNVVVDGIGLFDEKNAQQYTGMKDKNGKEIWEGDVCVWNQGTTGGYGDPFVVRFSTNDGGGSAALSSFSLCQAGEAKPFSMVCGKDKKDLEVIENIASGSFGEIEQKEQRPKFPPMMMLREGDTCSAKCETCGSSLHRTFLGTVVGCLGPECPNYYNKSIKK